MRKRIVFAGGGSIQFAPGLLSDAIAHPGLPPLTLVLHDIDAERLELVDGFARRLLPLAKSDLSVEATTDPRAALTGADAAIISIELDRFETWEVDRRIPRELGIEQALGENGGPGGLFHALRMIPGAVTLCRTVEELCPEALVLNLSNPMSRVCQAIYDTTRVRLVGLCHEIEVGKAFLSRVLGMPKTELVVEAAGINHFSWFTKIEDSSGTDLYPRLRKIAEADPSAYVEDDRLLVSEMFRVTKMQCVTNDSHAGEYLRFGHRPRCAWTPDRRPRPFFEDYQAEVARTEARVRAYLEGTAPIPSFVSEASGEAVIPILARVFRGERWSGDAINVPNAALIDGLPAWSVVEVPGSIGPEGGTGRRVEGVPEWLVAQCAVQVQIHRLTVRAALHGDRDAALQALLIDPSVPDPVLAERVLDALLKAHRSYLPHFA